MHLTAKNLTVIHQEPGGISLPALGPVSFDIPSGQFVCLVGPSGGGKSTLIRVFAGLQKPSQGIALLDGEAITKPSPHIGLMFQEANLMPWRTVVDNVALPLELAGVGKSERHTAAEKLLATLGLSDFAAAYPRQLSGGMAQRVALGRVLSLRPAVLLLDEPFGALDALTREQVSFDLLKAWDGQRQTVLMVTHDIQEAVLLADRIFVMSRRPGRIVEDIPVTLSRPRSPDDIYLPTFIETTRGVREAINRA
jgi:NitT/TauT family transport system ATP-binding protein